ncbi:AAA family ATPase [Succinivibrio dextrinosolvens]|uniref:AAA family ATPase n=1 Tax=Succinivibrio dextrinosolvens TaxID=83771 RepID=UPI00241FD16D|nr:AAA family ATPase [Succinivibrio dextrinosolvens]MBE6422100.1 hypothetical protein [Succinivibrio dextrinosolvens]
MKEIAQSENIEQFSLKNYIYIDKTEYIYNLIKKYDRVFFSRPRRFGKSLTINTIGTLFEKGVEPYFKGTWIYDKWTQNTCPVLHLSFLKFSVSDLDNFKRDFCNEILKFAKTNNITDFTDDKEPKVLIGNIFSAMPEDMHIVLLIDEYDCQLTANINNKELYEKFRLFIREFYAVLKGEKHIRFMALTGVTRLKDVSIFSVGSDIKDLSYDHAYSQMIGFTREEIKKFYIDYLKLGISYEKHIKTDCVTDNDIEEFLDRMAEHYDSYCFDEIYENKVFSTYSVNCFLQSISQNQRVIFGDYWYEAGGIPSILKNYMESHEIEIDKFQTSEISINYDDFMNPTSLPYMNENVLMCQTGYLTLKSEIKPPRRIKLGSANREVKAALNSLLSQKFFNPDALDSFYDADSILEKGSVEEIIEHLNKVLATIPYDKYPVENESILRALLLMYLSGLRCDVRSEQHNFKGSSDLLVNFKTRRVIIELKFSKDGKDTDTLLKAAQEQIRRREYGIEKLGDRELLQIAAVFDGSPNMRKITEFKQIG